MGQHNRIITCVDCPAVISLRLAKASWHAVTGSGRAGAHAPWRCVDCERRRRAPKVSNFARIKLPPREPLTGNVARLVVSTRPSHTESPALREQAVTAQRREASLPRLSRPTMRASVLLAAVGMLAGPSGMPPQAPELPPLIRDLIAAYHGQRQGAVLVSVSQRELILLETDPAHINGLRDSGLTFEITSRNGVAATLTLARRG